MAARNKRTHDYKTREKIQTTQLVKRLTSHALGEVDLSTSQVRSIEVLLRKTLPDLQSVQLSTDEDGIKLVTKVEREFVAKNQDG